MRKARPTIERFWSKVRKTAECWYWVGFRDRQGYGRFYEPKNATSAHRASWHIHYGEIPRDLCVLHKCDNPSCVRPDHLYVGTNADNVRDRTERKRHWANRNPREFQRHAKAVGGLASKRPGEKNPRAKLTADDIRSIRASKEAKYILIEKYGISRSNLWLIQTGQRWKSVA